jgi:hypothetical protein
MTDFHDIHRHVCECGHVIHTVKKVFGASGKGPKPGDKNLCIECGRVTVYDEQGSLRQMTAAEAQDWRLLKLQRQRGKIKKKLNWQRRREGKP